MSFSANKYHFNPGSLLEGLPREEFRLLKRNMVRMEVKRKKVVFEAGVYPKGVYVLRKGKVKIFQMNREGKEQIAYIYHKGDTLGFRPLLCDEPNPVTATTLEDCVFSFIPKKDFMAAIERSPTLCQRLLVNLSHEFSVWVNRITMFGQQPVRSRVALSLLILNEQYRKEGQADGEVTINLSRKNLASYVGATEETLVRMLRSLKDEKVIKTQGRNIVVLKPKALELISDAY